MEAMLTKGWAG